MAPPREAEDVVEGLYEAAADAGLWPLVLAQAAELFEADGAQIGHVDHADNRLSFLVTHGYQFTPERVRQYEAVMHEDVRLVRLAQRPFLPMHCRMIVTDEELHASRLYRDVLAPDGVEYSLGVNLIEERQSTTFFVALRRPGRRCFGKADCALLGELVPHLRRVLRLYRQFADFDFGRLATLEALDQVPLGVFVVRREGRLVTCNRTAEYLAAAGIGLSLTGGRVSASDAPLAHRLRQVIDDVVSDARPRTLTIFRSDDEPLRILVASLPGERIGRTLARPAGDLAVIFVNDPRRSQDAPWEHLQHMFGLFPGEAKLLALLTAGQTLREAAAGLNLTTNSARQYLKNVFAKTETHSQSALIRKVMDSPLWISKRSRE